jgi:hypothetical protein
LILITTSSMKLISSKSVEDASLTRWRQRM